MSRLFNRLAIFGCVTLTTLTVTIVLASPRLTDQLDEHRPSQNIEGRIYYKPKPPPTQTQDRNNADMDLVAYESQLFQKVNETPEDISALQDYGFFLMNINQRSAGIRYLDKAIHLSKHPHQKTNIVLGIARLEITQGTQSNARNVLTKLLENPTLPEEFAAETHFLLGLSYYREVFFESSRSPQKLANLQKEWNKTLSLDPNYVDWRDSRWTANRIQRVLTSVQKGRRSPHGPGGFAH